LFGQYKGLGAWAAPAMNMDKGARRQVKDTTAGKKFQAAEGSNEYNIWYGKFIGENWSDRYFKDREASATRCRVALDAGKTVAGTDAYICLHFARGNCSNGSKCSFVHCIPLKAQEDRIDFMHDCFGRERHSGDRDDMMGTGSFNRECRTLYLSGLKPNCGPEIGGSIYKHFSEFGEIVKLRVIDRKQIAFVTYRHRHGAEFAKEAMQNQTLDNDELLSVRWAFEDPNPHAQAEQHRQRDTQVRELLEEKGVALDSADFAFPSHYSLAAPLAAADDDDAAAAAAGGGAKRQRLEALAGSDVASAYPDTSVQFDAQPALDHSSAVAAIAEAYAPVSRDKAIAEQEKREAAAAAAKAAQAAAAAKRQRDAAINQAQSKLDGVLSGIGGEEGEALEWELPSEEEEEAAAAGASDLRSTEEWKQYVATYGQSYTERYFASYYHSQMLPVYGAAAALDYLKQNNLPTDHLH